MQVFVMNGGGSKTAQWSESYSDLWTRGMEGKLLSVTWRFIFLEKEHFVMT